MISEEELEREKALVRAHKRAASDEIMALLKQLGELTSRGHEMLKQGLDDRRFMSFSKQLDYDLYLRLYDVYVNDMDGVMLKLWTARFEELKKP